MKTISANSAKFLENISMHSSIHNMKSDILLQFDDFMLNRLTKEIPVLNMFVDEKLISELKTVFEKELNHILPNVIQKNISPEEIINNTIITGLLQVMKKSIKRKLLFFYFLSIASACIKGYLYVIAYFYISYNFSN